MYKVYRHKGIPQCICKDLPDGATMNIPFNKQNTDFKIFLEWNSKQKIPLDYKTVHEEIKSIYEIKQEQAKAEVKALKDKLTQGQKLTDKERNDVIDSLIQLLG